MKKKAAVVPKVKSKPFTITIDPEATITLSEMFMENQMEMNRNSTMAMGALYALFTAGKLDKYPILVNYVKEYWAAYNENKMLYLASMNIN